MTKPYITLRWEDGAETEFTSGTDAETALRSWGAPLEDIAAVYVNNEVRPLSAPLDINAAIRPVLYTSHEGRTIYRASLAFLLGAASEQVSPGRRLIVGHSLGNGYYYYFADGEALAPFDIARLKEKLQSLIDAALPISFYYVSYGEALAMFSQKGMNDTAALLEHRITPKVPVYECGGWVDLAVSPALVPRTDALKVFDLYPYDDGFLLRYPTSATGGKIGEFEDSPRLFAVYREYKQWGRIVRLHSAGELNRLSANNGIKDFIRIAEAFHEKKLSEAAGKIYEKREDVKLVLIAGPSSSGKTTTAKRIAVQLRVLGLEPLAVSLDDYYNPPEMAPLDDEGKPDLEALEALDVPYLNDQLSALLSGKEISLPAFDFKSSTRRAGRTIKADRRTIIILEGIHGLNDNLTSAIPRGKKFKLYVSPLTQLNIDDHNRVPTSDNRVIRRMVRDNQFRGSSAAKTLSMWPSVRRGEQKYIFPYQDGADFIFNSALDYELAVLRFYAEPLLHTVSPREKEFAQAVRLLGFLENFTPILPLMVPPGSILREFIGGSDFKY